jgi:hypothetical protein
MFRALSDRGNAYSVPLNPGEQARHADVDVERFPVQADTATENLDVGEGVVAGRLESLHLARREGEAAAIGEFDMHPPGRRLVAGGGRARLVGEYAPAARLGLGDQGIRN